MNETIISNDESEQNEADELERYRIEKARNEKRNDIFNKCSNNDIEPCKLCENCLRKENILKEHNDNIHEIVDLKILKYELNKRNIEINKLASTIEVLNNKINEIMNINKEHIKKMIKKNLLMNLMMKMHGI